MNKTAVSQEVELVGHVSVDSGQVIISDPCYIMEGDLEFAPDGSVTATVHDPKDGKVAGYAHPCEVTCSDARVGEFPVKGFATAVASSSGYGDGNYPVYAKKNDEGRVVELTIYFDEDPHTGEASWASDFVHGVAKGQYVFDEDKGHYVDLNEDDES
jgi:hypothetical protein